MSKLPTNNTFDLDTFVGDLLCDNSGLIGSRVTLSLPYNLFMCVYIVL